MLRRGPSLLSSLVLGLLLITGSGEAKPKPRLEQGRLRVITYNVAGLPEGVSRSRPVQNLPRIGELLSRYDLAVVQEDFAYPDVLRQRLRLPYGSAPFVRGEQLHFGDGLSQFSRLPLTEVARVPWSACHGVFEAFFDCLTPKGLMLSRVELVPGETVDVYDLHMDAGWSAEDKSARKAQLEQLASAIERFSAGRAVIVGGDFNLTRKEAELLRKFATRTGLTDACTVLACPEPQRIDRVLYRGSPTLELRARNWKADRSFVDASGRPLSDHLPVVVELGWARLAP